MQNLCSVLLLLLFFNFTISAQTFENKTLKQCDALSAKQLVEQQVDEGKSVEETDKRLKIYLRAADFSWKLDEQTARKYFVEAVNFAEKRFNHKGLENETSKRGKFSIITSTTDYRTIVIQAIAKRDGAWAKTLSEKLLKDYEADVENRKNPYEKTRELSALLQIAVEAADTNPDLSLHFFRRVMQYPLDQHWYRTLYWTAEKNRPLTDQIYSELLRVYATESPRKLLFLSAYPFASNRTFGVDKNQDFAVVPASVSANENLQIQFLNTFFNRIDKFSNDANELYKTPEANRLPEISYIVSALQDIEPIILQKYPRLLQRFNNVKVKANGLLSGEARNDMEGRQKMSERNNLSFDERIKELEEADPADKFADYRIVSLISDAKKEEDYEKLESWIEKIKKEQTRADARNYFYFLRSKFATEENRLIEAEDFAEEVSELQLRSILLFDISEKQLKSDYRQNEAESILLKVSKLTRKAKPSVEKAQVLLGLANMFEKVNHAYALDELGEAVRTINQLENPNIFASSIQQIIVGDQFTMYASFYTPGFNMEKAFSEIGKNDFQLSLAHAKSFDDRYFRTLAVLAVAGNCVNDKRRKSEVRDEK